MIKPMLKPCKSSCDFVAIYSVIEPSAGYHATCICALKRVATFRKRDHLTKPCHAHDFRFTLNYEFPFLQTPSRRSLLSFFKVCVFIFGGTTN